jgi:hypothetical protein
MVNCSILFLGLMHINQMIVNATMGKYCIRLIEIKKPGPTGPGFV